MKSNKILSLTLKSLSNLVVELSDEDLEKVALGSHSIELKIVRNRSNVNNLSEMENFSPVEVTRKLSEFTDRIVGSNYLRDFAKNKKFLELLAKHLDIAFSKQDKIEDLINKIIESTVGARLRSSAIRGSEI